MRRACLALVVLLVCATFPLQSALGQNQTTIGAWQVTDNPNDVQYGYQQNNLPVGLEHIDVIGIEISNETAKQLSLVARLRALEAPAYGGLFAQRSLKWSFTFGQTNFSILHQAESSFASMLIQPPQGTFIQRQLNASVDRSAKEIHIHVAREFLTNEDGFVLTGGLALDRIRVEATAANITGPHAFDLAPDVGFAPEFRSTFVEMRQNGNLQLTTTQPLRVSNGEATTIVYTVQLSNAGDADERVVLRVQNSNPEWRVRVPEWLTVAARSGIQFPVILAMNASHEHGGLGQFTVTANSTADPTQGAELPLGVVWTDTPQPAGHHSRMWLHEKSANSGIAGYGRYQQVWMNALAEDSDPNAKDGPVTANSGTSNGGVWIFPLQPALLIGLDFDVNQTAKLIVEVNNVIGSPNARVKARLDHCAPDTGRYKGQPDFCRGAATVLGIRWPMAEGTSAAGAHAAGTKRAFEIDLAIRPDADIVPYLPNANLELIIEYVSDIPQPMQTLSVETESAQLDLPLVEYHDPVIDELGGVGHLRLQRDGVIQRPINPGRTALFGFNLSTERDDEVRLSIEGLNPTWASIEGTSKRRLKAMASEPFTVLVQAPEDAQVGEAADLFLVASSSADPNIVALTRFQVRVVDPNVLDVPDQAAPLDVRSEGSPGPAVIALILALFGAAWLRRRML